MAELRQLTNADIDGSGNDTCDPLEFTLGEIRQAFMVLEDRLDEHFGPVAGYIVAKAFGRPTASRPFCFSLTAAAFEGDEPRAWPRVMRTSP